MKAAENSPSIMMMEVPAGGAGGGVSPQGVFVHPGGKACPPGVDARGRSGTVQWLVESTRRSAQQRRQLLWLAAAGLVALVGIFCMSLAAFVSIKDTSSSTGLLVDSWSGEVLATAEAEESQPAEELAAELSTADLSAVQHVSFGEPDGEYHDFRVQGFSKIADDTALFYLASGVVALDARGGYCADFEPFLIGHSPLLSTLSCDREANGGQRRLQGWGRSKRWAIKFYRRIRRSRSKKKPAKKEDAAPAPAPAAPAPLPVTSSSASFVVHVSAAGSNDNTGLTAGSKVATLGRAYEIIKAAKPSGTVDVLVYSEGTIYEGASVTWRFFNGKDITIRPAPGQADLPTFDGCGPTGCGERRRFVTVAGSSGENTNIHFRALRVQNYWEGISFSGSSTELDGWNGGNSVKDCVFEKMGNKYIEDNDGAYATVRLQNSRNNVLTGNRFYKIENTNGGKVKDTYLHAFYIAHKSSHNLIKGNVFELNTGDAVRLRDMSNFNTIEGNTFKKAGVAGYSEWYCSDREKCSKWECPSWGNVFKANRLHATYPNRATDKECISMNVWKLYVDNGNEAGCSLPDGANSNIRRIRTSGNTKDDSLVGKC